MSKNFDETVRLQFEIRREWIQEIRRERLQGIAEDASSAPRLASSSAASFPGRNECPGTHCSLIEQEEREDSSCQICHRVWDERKDGGEDRVARTERESDSRKRKMADLLVLPRPAKSMQNGAGFSGKNLSILGLPKKSGVSATGKADGKNAGAALTKRERNRAVCPEYQIMKGERVKMGESRTLTRQRGRSEREHGKGRVDSTVNEGRIQGGKGEHVRRASLEEVEGSMSG